MKNTIFTGMATAIVSPEPLYRVPDRQRYQRIGCHGYHRRERHH